MDCIRTVHELIDTFGGDTAVADWCCITQGAVANWKQRGEIPPAWHLRFYARALSEGREIDLAGVFGLPDREASVIGRAHRPLPEPAAIHQ